MKENYFIIFERYKDKQDSDLDVNIEITINKIKYLGVHFESDRKNLILRNENGGGIISLVELPDNMRCFIFAFYSEYRKIQSFEGVIMTQNLDYLIKAVNSTKNYIENFKNLKN